MHIMSIVCVYNKYNVHMSIVCVYNKYNVHLRSKVCIL